jgi:hypothetical protein
MLRLGTCTGRTTTRSHAATQHADHANVHDAYSGHAILKLSYYVYFLKAVHIFQTIYKNTGRGRISALTGPKWQHIIFLNAVYDFTPPSMVAASKSTMVTRRFKMNQVGRICFVL